MAVVKRYQDLFSHDGWLAFKLAGVDRFYGDLCLLHQRPVNII